MIAVPEGDDESGSSVECCVAVAFLERPRILWGRIFAEIGKIRSCFVLRIFPRTVEKSRDPCSICRVNPLIELWPPLHINAGVASNSACDRIEAHQSCPDSSIIL